MKNSIVIILLFTMLLCLNCTEIDNEEWGITGTVYFTSIEGGCWYIVDDDSTSYEPMNFNEEYKIDSLPVAIFQTM